MHLLRRLSLSIAILISLMGMGYMNSQNSYARRDHDYLSYYYKRHSHKCSKCLIKQIEKFHIHSMNYYQSHNKKVNGYQDYLNLMRYLHWVYLYDSDHHHVQRLNSPVISFFNEYIPKISRYHKTILDRTYLNLVINYYMPKVTRNSVSRTHVNKYGYRSISTPSNPKLNDQGNSLSTEIRQALVTDINNTRSQYRLQPLKVTDALQRTANYRDPRVQYGYEHYDDYKYFDHDTSNPSDNWIHGEDTHDDGGDYLDKHHYNWGTWAANAGTWYYNNEKNDYSDGDLENSPDNTPSRIAQHINDDLIYHDMAEGNDDGHRDNELDPYIKYLGVGVVYDHNNKMGSFNEQYAE